MNDSDIKITDITASDIWARMPRRIADSHKGTYGKLLCVAGSSRYRGAAALAVEGALRGGCGIVTLASVEPAFASVQPRLPEAILLSCEPDTIGGISQHNAEKLLAEYNNGTTALLMGPGMGNTADTAALVRTLVTSAHFSVILDADALNALSLAAGISQDSNPLSGASSTFTSAGTKCDADTSTVGATETTANAIPAPASTTPVTLPRTADGSRLVITPHPGEMARLLGTDIATVKADREHIALTYARDNDCIVVLKEHRTLIAAPDGSLWRNTTGNSGLARGGSGDILTGLIGSLLAQGLDPLDAAIAGVWLHGAAAERCSRRKSETAMLPHDIFRDLGELMLEHGL